MQLRTWIALLGIINVGLLYLVVEAWHAREVDQLAQVTGRQSVADEGVSAVGSKPGPEAPRVGQPNRAISPDASNQSDRTQIPVSKRAASCEYLGPFELSGNGDPLKPISESFVLGAQKGGHAYRLVTKPYESSDAAYDTVKRLRLLGIDSFVMTSGPFAGGISLGIFKEEQTALSVRKEINDQSVLQRYSITIVPDVERWPQWWIASTEKDSLKALLLDGSVAKIGPGEPVAIPCEALEKFDPN